MLCVSTDEQVVDAGESAFAQENERLLGSHLGYEVFRALHGDRRRVAVTDYAGTEPSEVHAEGVLVLATLLADRLKVLTASKRVGIVLPPGAGATVANLAVVFAGTTVTLQPLDAKQRRIFCLAPKSTTTT